METRELTFQDKDVYNRLASHPLQSWAWGEFRKKSGVLVVRIGSFSGKKLVSAFQLTFHRIPHLPFTVGYLPKSPIPDRTILTAIESIGRKHNAIFIQIEPNVIHSSKIEDQRSKLLRPSAHPLFTKFTFHIDLKLPEAELLKRMSAKTRYNIRLAQKRGVTIQEESTPTAFTSYLDLTRETASRQGFYAHNDTYHRLMWETLSAQDGPASGGQSIAHLLTARYQGKILVTWILFLFKDILYYPYGASSTEHREVMASNLMMWEALRWGKTHGAKIFDLWGTPGPSPTRSDPYFGFHRFKMGYGPQLVEFIGSYDLVLKQPHYQIFTLVDKARWIFLRHKSKFKVQK